MAQHEVAPIDNGKIVLKAVNRRMAFTFGRCDQFHTAVSLDPDATPFVYNGNKKRIVGPMQKVVLNTVNSSIELHDTWAAFNPDKTCDERRCKGSGAREVKQILSLPKGTCKFLNTTSGVIDDSVTRSLFRISEEP